MRKKQRELLEKEMMSNKLITSQLENLRSQMNPHFIFNALNSIQEYIVLNEKDLASSYLIKFSRLIRIYLDHSRMDEVSLSEELIGLNIYLQLEKNRFENILEYHINVAENVDTKKIKIPPLFLQPYVENALKHGLLHKKRDRKLWLDLELNKSEDILYCKITDNGIGIKASNELNKKRNPYHKSFATQANNRRVALLNANRDQKILVEIRDLKLGTEVFIKIPL